MTHSTAVDELRDDEALVELDGDEIAGPLLAAIQHSYEEAKACIEDLGPSSPPATPDGTEPHPGTEKIDLRLVGLPAVPPAPTPPTAAMSLAARVVAQQRVAGGVGSYAAASGAGPERRAASAHEESGARAGNDSPDLPAALRRGRATMAAMITRWFAGSAALAGGR